MVAGGLSIPWEVYDEILAEARERNDDVMRNAWIMRARHAAAESRELRAQTRRYRSAAGRLMRLLEDDVRVLHAPTGEHHGGWTCGGRPRRSTTEPNAHPLSAPS